MLPECNHSTDYIEAKGGLHGKLSCTICVIIEKERQRCTRIAEEQFIKWQRGSDAISSFNEIAQKIREGK